jgi:putative hydrolase of the HAD superfamily
MIKGIIFDYGATLDTNGRHWAHVLWEAYRHAEIPIEWEEFKEAYVYGERALAKSPIVVPNDTFKEVLRKKITEEFRFLRDNALWCVSQEEIRAKLDVAVSYAYEYALNHIKESKQVLGRLNKHYPLVLVSNFYGNIHSVLNEFELSCYFCKVVESAVVGVRKPDPAIFKLAIEHLGIHPEEAFVVGDSYTKDIIPSQSLGCQTIWIKGEGWDSSDSETSDAASFVVYNINEVEQVINNFILETSCVSNKV